MTPPRHLIATFLLSACAAQPPTGVDDRGSGDTDSDSVAAARCEATDLSDDLTVADVQALGTHNSYHIEPETLLHPSHAYTHPPLDRQLDLGVRAFELDIHRREDGTFAVFHLPVIDEVSTCDTLEDCLGLLRTWSDAHPCHVPLTVWIEPKDELDAGFPGLTTLTGHLDDLDDGVRDALPRLITPDRVRGDHPDLPTALAADGWPTLAEARGHVLVTLLDSGDHRAEYLDGHPALEGRALFVDTDDTSQPFAATFKINDALQDAERVAALVSEGFLVSSNAPDEDPVARDAALGAGPHHLKSDFVDPDIGGPLFTMPGGSPRCHPLRGDGCGPEALEGPTERQ